MALLWHGITYPCALLAPLLVCSLHSMALLWHDIMGRAARTAGNAVGELPALKGIAPYAAQLA